MKFISAILIVLLTLQSFYPLVIHSYYYANKSYIASVLCENRNKPQLHCNGKCYLKKQLKKAGEQEHSDKTTTGNIEPAVYVAPPLLSNAPRPVNIRPIIYHPLLPDNYSYNFHNSLFRPPCI